MAEKPFKIIISNPISANQNNTLETLYINPC